MLPTMQPMDTSRTKRARATKSFEQVRVGPLRLYFSHFELIGFQVDGALPIVCAPLKPIGITTGSHVEHHRLELEPDKARWLSKIDFELEWREISRAVFQPH
jgi:hypothetical protein